jgi:hypothetical protein
MDEFIVTNCHKCPLAQFDDGLGYFQCNHPKGDIVNDKWEFHYELSYLPKYDVHELCPLKKDDIKIKLL